jgi:hypothetical protein
MYDVHDLRGIINFDYRTAAKSRRWWLLIDQLSEKTWVTNMGMDVRVRESGQWRGQQKLTEKGNHELRRLLFNAAMQGRRSPLWEPCYPGLRGRGFSTTAAFVALG